MALPKQAPPSGAPEWIVTYGDMMSLLLCFFILLAALANYDDRDKMLMTALESIRHALGSPGQHGWMPDDELDFKSFVAQLEALTLKAPQDANRGQSHDEGLQGPETAVRSLRDGVEFSVGGPLTFERFKAELLPASRETLAEFAKPLVGYRNKIEVRGHATCEPLPADSEYGDQMALSLARAQAVRLELIRLGIAPERIRVAGAGHHEPKLVQAYTEAERAVNRRVDILVHQTRVEDYEATAKPDRK